MIDDTYTFDASDGVTYTGNAAYVLNQLDSAECTMNENLRDLITDSDQKIIESEVLLRNAIVYVLDHAADIAPYL